MVSSARAFPAMDLIKRVAMSADAICSLPILHISLAISCLLLSTAQMNTSRYGVGNGSYLWTGFTEKKIEMRNISHKTRDNGDAVTLQNSRFFCERERRGRYSDERPGESVEMVRKAGERRYREEKTVLAGICTDRSGLNAGRDHFVMLLGDTIFNLTVRVKCHRTSTKCCGGKVQPSAAIGRSP